MVGSSLLEAIIPDFCMKVTFFAKEYEPSSGNSPHLSFLATRPKIKVKSQITCPEKCWDYQGYNGVCLKNPQELAILYIGNLESTYRSGF